MSTLTDRDQLQFKLVQPPSLVFYNADSAIKYTSRPLRSVGIGSQGIEEGSQVDILVEKYIQVEEGGERSWGLVFHDEIAGQTGLN